MATMLLNDLDFDTVDPEVAALIRDEYDRQAGTICLTCRRLCFRGGPRAMTEEETVRLRTLRSCRLLATGIDSPKRVCR